MEGTGWFVCPRGKEARVAVEESRAHITLLACISATGLTLDPMFIIKGKSERVYHETLSKLTKHHVIATGTHNLSFIHICNFSLIMYK